jgi:hypothetical protein
MLMELWLAGAPALEIKVMLSSLAASAAHLTVIEECWSKRGNERRYTVPPKIKRKLCQLAVAHVAELHHHAILRRRQGALRKHGLTDTQIGKILSHDGERSNFEPPDLKKVLQIVNRSAPAITLRRKATSRKLRK